MKIIYRVKSMPDKNFYANDFKAGTIIPTNIDINEWLFYRRMPKIESSKIHPDFAALLRDIPTIDIIDK